MSLAQHANPVAFAFAVPFLHDEAIMTQRARWKPLARDFHDGDTNVVEFGLPGGFAVAARVRDAVDGTKQVGVVEVHWSYKDWLSATAGEKLDRTRWYVRPSLDREVTFPVREPANQG